MFCMPSHQVPLTCYYFGSDLWQSEREEEPPLVLRVSTVTTHPCYLKQQTLRKKSFYVVILMQKSQARIILIQWPIQGIPSLTHAPPPSPRPPTTWERRVYFYPHQSRKPLHHLLQSKNSHWFLNALCQEVRYFISNEMLRCFFFFQLEANPRASG